jgi:YidC/Oxa1 family membrane protein insertase
MDIFHTLIFVPTFNALLFLQKVLPGHDLGIAIIVVTLVIKLILYIPSLAAIKSSRQLQEIQPLDKALQQKYKDNPQQLAQERMKLYKEHKVNPASSCLPIIIQVLVFYQLYRVFLNGLQINDQGFLLPEHIKDLYTPLQSYFTLNPINTLFLNWINLKGTGNIALAILAGATQFWQTKMLAAPKEPNIPGAKDESVTAATNRTMTYVLPFMTAIITYRFPAGLALYWSASSIFTIIQQYIFLRRHPLPKITPSV